MFISLLFNFLGSMESGLEFAIRESNTAGKGILVILFFGSLFSWSVMLTKFMEVRGAKNFNKRFLKEFRLGQPPLNIYMSGVKYKGSPAFLVYQAACSELLFFFRGVERDEDGETLGDLVLEQEEIPQVSETAMSGIRTMMERATSEQALAIEKRMGLLATAVSAAPFLGLLGTIWGVMNTFSGIAIAGKATLAAMAPGVSGALVTTVAGLLVAIPAMLGLNYLVVSIREVVIELDNFSAELYSSFEHHYRL